MNNLIRAAESVNLVPLLRPPGVDESSILRALDSGAHGLMVPNINSISQVESLINFAFYPPIGSRGHSPFTRSGMFVIKDSQENKVKTDFEMRVSLKTLASSIKQLFGFENSNEFQVKR